jgi:hypothetical protein
LGGSRKLIVDLVLATAAAKVTKTVLVSFTRVPDIWGSPIEWFSGALILGILLYVGRNWGESLVSKSRTHAIEIAPPWERAGYQSEEIWKATIAEQNKFIESGRSVEGLFRPLQIEA